MKYLVITKGRDKIRTFLSPKTVLHLICNRSFKVFGKGFHRPVSNLSTFGAVKYKFLPMPFGFSYSIKNIIFIMNCNYMMHANYITIFYKIKQFKNYLAN